uniref:GATA-type domain-containing protein n=1 Tax=Panagrolaimus davidi TaxID=227884 RepID=A0A914PKV1_9BILA
MKYCRISLLEIDIREFVKRYANQAEFGYQQECCNCSAKYWSPRRNYFNGDILCKACNLYYVTCHKDSEFLKYPWIRVYTDNQPL